MGRQTEHKAISTFHFQPDMSPTKIAIGRSVGLLSNTTYYH